METENNLRSTKFTNNVGLVTSQYMISCHFHFLSCFMECVWLITGPITPNQTAASKQLPGEWLLLPHDWEQCNYLLSGHHLKDGVATDSCFTLFVAHQ